MDLARQPGVDEGIAGGGMEQSPLLRDGTDVIVSTTIHPGAVAYPLRDRAAGDVGVERGDHGPVARHLVGPSGQHQCATAAQHPVGVRDRLLRAEGPSL